MAQQQHNTYQQENNKSQQYNYSEPVFQAPVYFGRKETSATPNTAQHNGSEGHHGTVPLAQAYAAHQQATALSFNQTDHVPEMSQHQHLPPKPSAVDSEHVCTWWQEIPEEERHDYRELCNATFLRDSRYTCSLVGKDVTKGRIAQHQRGETKQAKAEFYRRAQKASYEKAKRRAGRERKAQDQLPDPDLHAQWAISAQVYDQAMAFPHAEVNNAGDVQPHQDSEPLMEPDAAKLRALAQAALVEMALLPDVADDYDSDLDPEAPDQDLLALQES